MAETAALGTLAARSERDASIASVGKVLALFRGEPRIDAIGRINPAKSAEERFWDRVDKLDTGCWRWRGKVASTGYGRIHRNGRQVGAHRFAYELLIGPVPSGLQLDHLCRNRWCVNPEHLEPVTGKVNQHRSPISQATINAAKTHCKWGHEFTPENTHIRPNGSRICRTCDRQRLRKAWTAGKQYRRRKTA